MHIIIESTDNTLTAQIKNNCHSVVDRSNGMPIEIKEWGHVLDPALLFETENVEYFVGIEMSDSCVRRTQHMTKGNKNMKRGHRNSKYHMEDEEEPVGF